MSDPTPQTPDTVPIHEGKPAFWERISLIWLIPVMALVVALGAAWNNYNSQGPLIAISFENAAGVKAGETELRYRDIRVGLVETVGFSDDLKQVRVGVRIAKEMTDFVDAESVFWVVRPEVTAQGVTGLDTVLSGVYIQGSWDGTPGGFQTEFKGLSTEPLLGMDNEGITFTLRSADSLPTADTPILYKGLQVGQVATAEINADGTGVTASAVIYEPYTTLVSSGTRFWDVSGFSFTLGTAGAQLNFDSFASLISGGITFETMGSGGKGLSENAVFELFASEEAARNDFLVDGDGESASVPLTMIFEENLPGLSSGAPVEMGGLRVGEVVSLTGLVDTERFGDDNVRLLTTMHINPSRIGLGEDAGSAELFDFLARRVEGGMRGQLTNASLLTGSLKIRLIDVADAPEGTLDRTADPYPIVPTTEAAITDVATSAQGVLQRVNDLPVEEVMQSAISFLDNATALVGSQALQEAPEELRGILTATRGVVESDDVQAMPGQVAGVLKDLEQISAKLNTIVTKIEREGVVDQLIGAIASVETAANSLPEIVDQASAILDDAGEVSLKTLADRTSALLASADALVNQPSTRALPQELNDALEQLTLTLEELREGGLVDSANATLASTRDAASAVEEATKLLPDIATQLRNVANQAGATLSNYGRESAFSRETSAALRQIEAAASAIERLARAIERNPNSLILGR
ncbi:MULTISPECIES: MlaD family protein [Roseobacteraceae]|uniref:Paraquat-inducible protein B n=1 Tax=Pseudosulfitobacter pseudonitzschiae TaxID=1402135 RepID=A0A221JYK9_9RHOB|nr:MULTISPECIES: MlaD family protein [Roseobacteraceae]ASM71730.1 paraquat-inducible protein B [Pseudosulfitobacter pseudonitzschiae]